MPVLHFVASGLVSAILLALAAALAGPAFELPGVGRDGLAAGTLPRFVVVVVAFLAILSFAGDFLKWWRGRRGEGQAEVPIATPWQAVLLGGGTLLLLAVYVVLWRPLPFPLATIPFMVLVTLLIAPPAERTGRGLTKILAMSLLFPVGVWLLFINALQVPLR